MPPPSYTIRTRDLHGHPDAEAWVLRLVAQRCVVEQVTLHDGDLTLRATGDSGVDAILGKLAAGDLETAERLIDLTTVR